MFFNYEKIIFEKYKKRQILFSFGELFPEIIGFIYSIISLGQFKGFLALEPLILEPLNKESCIEYFPEILQDEDIGYIEPVLYDNHISVLMIKKSSYFKTRINILIDFSRYHIIENIKDNIIFPLEIYINNFPYPAISIQKGNTCGLWLYGIIDCIYSNINYKDFKDIWESVKNETPKLFVDVINNLSYNLYGIKNIIEKSNIFSIKYFDENKIYDSIFGSEYSFNKESFQSNYFSLANILGYVESTNSEKLFGTNLLLEYQLLMDKIKNYLGLVELNNRYFKAYSSKEIYEKYQKGNYEHLIQKLKVLFLKVNKNF